MAPAFRDSGAAQGERRPGLRGGSGQCRLEPAGQVGGWALMPGQPPFLGLIHSREQTVLELGWCEGGHVGDGINAARPRMKIQLCPHASGLLSCHRTWAVPHLSSTERGATKAFALPLAAEGPCCSPGLPPASEGEERSVSGHLAETFVPWFWPLTPCFRHSPVDLSYGGPGLQRLFGFPFGSCCLILMYLLQISTVFILRPCF